MRIILEAQGRLNLPETRSSNTPRRIDVHAHFLPDFHRGAAVFAIIELDQPLMAASTPRDAGALPPSHR